MIHNLRHIICLLMLAASSIGAQAYDIALAQGSLRLTPLTDNAMRIRFVNIGTRPLPEYIYTAATPTPHYEVSRDHRQVTIRQKSLTVRVTLPDGLITATDHTGRTIFHTLACNLTPSTVQSAPTQIATLTFDSPDDESLYGLGQFQDGYVNIRGLSRRLTQVNTQIAIPMLISSRGFGLLWNNYGLTEYNPGDSLVVLRRTDVAGETHTVDQTSTLGNQRETRQSNVFAAEIRVDREGDYALLLDAGQTMARRHLLTIDGDTAINLQNIWLPPTASTIVHLTPGSHQLLCQAEHNDRPTVCWRRVTPTTTLRSPVAEAVDFTLFAGSPDEVVSAYRRLTGEAPMMPLWALGYIHCRERFHSSEEILQTATRLRRDRYPTDLIVQDWQYWGRHGWNSMTFDKAHYPDPKALVDSLHTMDMRFMLSVWSKIDRSSDVGREMEDKGYYIPGTDWVDFFNPAAAAEYWRLFSSRLLRPYGIDAWWQDATEPENDDLANRRVGGGTWAGEQFRNMYTLLVSKTVYEGSLRDRPDRRTMILTRCGFPGIQRYNSAVWSGDVGHDFPTLRRQIAAGLGLSATGLPWWTYDAGGFFRPGQAQYASAEYREVMIRWLQASVFLPLMRVHGYMSNTEFWNYGPETERLAHRALSLRYRLMPYIYAHAAAIHHDGQTLLRPLVMDFASDPEALAQDCQYMFGRSLLVCPIVERRPTTWKVYLPRHEGGWYRFMDHQHAEGGQTLSVAATMDEIPVFVPAGSIVPLAAEGAQTAREALESPIEIQVYPGRDAEFTLYFDDGETHQYREGRRERISLRWDDSRRRLTLGRRDGHYQGMPAVRSMTVRLMGTAQPPVKLTYRGRAAKVHFARR